MTMAIARQLDRCDVCGQKVHRRELVLTQVDFLAVGGSNYFNYSSYDSSWWELVFGTDAGTISSGPYADRFRIVIGDDNTRTESFGTQTWTVGAGFSVYSGNLQIKSSSIDISAWDSFTVSFDFGYYDRETDINDLTPAVLIYNTDGVTGATSVNTRRELAKSGRYFGTMNVSDVAAALDTSAAVFHLCLRTHGDGGEKVWIDRFQLEKNVSTMGAFLPTAGASVDRVDTPMMTTRKVCPRCRERVLSRSDRYGQIAEIRDEGPVTVAMQEI